jgi:hypothetical protein
MADGITVASSKHRRGGIWIKEHQQKRDGVDLRGDFGFGISPVPVPVLQGFALEKTTRTTTENGHK